jgi:imidazole glycerol-phosphate synthase subunit HisH
VGRVVTVVDYGLGNLLSVRRAFERVGADTLLTEDPEEVRRADRLVLPGVGAFSDGMRELERRGLVDALRAYAQTGRPLLGICLGMHLLMDESDEFGRTEGLGVIPGRVVDIRSLAPTRSPKVPHIGWSPLLRPRPEAWSATPLESLEEGACVYFVHSFAAVPAEESARLADTEYDGCRFAAVVRSGSILGTQFHPEKSGPAGLAIVEGFLRETGQD